MKRKPNENAPFYVLSLHKSYIGICFPRNWEYVTMIALLLWKKETKIRRFHPPPLRYLVPISPRPAAGFRNRGLMKSPNDETHNRGKPARAEREVISIRGLYIRAWRKTRLAGLSIIADADRQTGSMILYSVVESPVRRCLSSSSMYRKTGSISPAPGSNCSGKILGNPHTLVVPIRQISTTSQLI